MQSSARHENQSQWSGQTGYRVLEEGLWHVRSQECRAHGLDVVGM